ncbi:Glyoxalase/Bleomycin resistance protein/Dioxygenase superfamily [Enterobacter asburiae]|uniref:Glyoxalase/Bleomycin resistance protein/Dioxygenase superfamily n=1 Tax=Enterobacter asburiae TaxID=61645 RepID=A0A376F9F5_ENTAS|nr:Glyoxalase/Bleomycin resistance protein/Dioxygenase superfamily [Enterobacter asburiae]
MRTQKRCLGCVAVVVDDYDRAIEYYTDKLGFTLVEDTPQPGKRWVVVSPNPESDCNILLARASNERQEALSAINAAAEFSCSFRRTIFGAITVP